MTPQQPYEIPNNADDASIVDPAAEAELAAYHSYDNFLRLHQSQLQTMGFPTEHYRTLYDKIYGEQFDAVESFAICQEEDKIGNECIALRSIPKSETIWLIEHSWSAEREEIIQSLRQDEDMWPRLEAIVDTDRRNEEEMSGKVADNEGSSSRDSAIPENEQIRLLADQYHLSYARAFQCWNEHHEDVIETAQVLSEESEASKSGSGSNINSEVDSEKVQRVKKLYERLRDNGLIGAYHVTIPREQVGQLRPDEVATIFYVDDEIGSAITRIYANDSECNCQISPFVCVTLNGLPISLLWLLKDVEENETLKAPYRKVVPEPPAWVTPN